MGVSLSAEQTDARCPGGSYLRSGPGKSLPLLFFLLWVYYNNYGSIVKETTSCKPLDEAPRVGCELIFLASIGQ